MKSRNNIVIKSTSGEKFGLNFENNSIAPCFGYTEEVYENKTEYRSENPHIFLNKPYYLFIKEISDSPVCEISPSGDVKLLIDNLQQSDIKTKINSNSEISGLTLTYRYGKNKNSDLVNFYEGHHCIDFKFYFLENSKQSNSKQSNSNQTNVKKSNSNQTNAKQSNAKQSNIKQSNVRTRKS